METCRPEVGARDVRKDSEGRADIVAEPQKDGEVKYPERWGDSS